MTLMPMAGDCIIAQDPVDAHPNAENRVVLREAQHNVDAFV
jgi:hypothetical protein